MDSRGICIIQTGVANVASVLAAFKRLGLDAELSVDPDHVLNAHCTVLPGVGAFKAGMDELTRLELLDPLRTRVTQGKKLLAICLGMQLLFEHSEESPGVKGIGLFSGGAELFPSELTVPQLGWNLVSAASACQIFSSGWAYFANSYRVRSMKESSAVALANYGGDFVAGFETKNILACQFHPELSGAWGLSLLQRWLMTKG